MIQDNPYVVCFGEVLWDIFPHGAKAGGAPFNVAYHLHKLGTDAKMLSRIGNDELGGRLIHQINDWGITSGYIQVDDKKATSTVVATVDEQNEAVYEITNHVAWDYIELLPAHKELVSNAGALVFGSLAARNNKTRETLFNLLDNAKLRIFDVNFRPPFVDTELIKNLLSKADIVKMNKAEMRHIMEFLDLAYITEDDSTARIRDRFKIREIVLTKGSKGASYFTEDESYSFPAVPVDIEDTVGSGDSFLAGFISQRIGGKDPERIMKEAVALGAFITSKAGACPDYQYHDFQQFKDHHFGLNL